MICGLTDPLPINTASGSAFSWALPSKHYGKQAKTKRR